MAYEKVSEEERIYLYKIRVKWTLDMKIRHFLKVVNNFIDTFPDSDIVASFSGGADSLVMLDILRKNINPNFPAVFADTGVEFPEIRKFVKLFKNVDIIKPVVPYKGVLDTYGYPIISKMTARRIRDLRKPVGVNEKTKSLILTGVTSTGRLAPSFKIANKWLYLVNAPFKISEQCCDALKKNPLNAYAKEKDVLYIIGTMASESLMRKKNYFKYGCNIFTEGNSKCRPLSIFTSEDIWEYIRGENLKYCEVYDCGYRHTGCISCGFGCHLEKGENRYQKLYKSHPKLWNYHIDNLGWGKVLDYIGIPYVPRPCLFDKNQYKNKSK